jgi:hypothetical protein
MSKVKPAVPKLRLVRPGGGRRRLVAFVVLFVLVLWVVNDPVGAAGVFTDVFTGLATFLRELG